MFLRCIRRARLVAGIAYCVIPAIYTTCKPTPPYQVTSFEEAPADQAGGASGTIATAATINSRGAQIDFGNGGATSTVPILVPDGVASVALTYPGDPTTGLHPLTVKGLVIQNVAVLTNVHRNAPKRWRTMIWYAANGTTIKTIHGP